MNSLSRSLGAAGLVAMFASATLCAADWPQWRGPDRTDHSPDTGLLKNWPAAGPKLAWLNKDVGLGYSGYAIAGGTLYTMGLRGEAELLIAVDATDGKELWAAEVGGRFKNDWGDGPRTSPTVAGGKVYAMGGNGDLLCADAKTGKKLWNTAMKALGGKTPGWGYCESVLVDDGKVICTPGGSRGTIAALDAGSGKILWQSKDWKSPAHYSSVVPATIQGRKQYVQLTVDSLAGIDARTGALLWKSDWPGRIAVIPTPIVKGNEVYIASGYGVGCKKVRVNPDMSVEDVWVNKVMKNHHGGVILVGDHLYGYSDGGGWICQDWKTGEEVWGDKSLGKGAVHFADGKLICLDESRGYVVLATANPSGWKEISRFTLTPQTMQRSKSGKIWTHPVVCDGKMYLRDQELLFCYDVK